MDASETLQDAFGRIRDGARGVVDGLDADALAYRPDDGANSIAWLLWHGARVQDDHVAEIADREQVWTADGWADRFDLPFDRHDTGYGHTPQEVAAVRPGGPDLLAGYQEAVAAMTLEYLATVDAEGLDRIIDRNWDPPVTVGIRLVSVIGDQYQHLGQAGYVRGMYERAST